MMSSCGSATALSRASLTRISRPAELSPEAGRGSRLRAAFERLDHLHHVAHFAARFWSVVICASYSISYNGGVSVWRVPLPEATGSSGELWPTTPGTAPCGPRTVCFWPRRCSIASFAAASAFSRSAPTTTPVSMWLLSFPSKIHQRQVIPRPRGYFRTRYRKPWWGNSMDGVCPAHPTITRRLYPHLIHANLIPDAAALVAPVRADFLHKIMRPNKT
jgi:hypothetical protein